MSSITHPLETNGTRALSQSEATFTTIVDEVVARAREKLGLPDDLLAEARELVLAHCVHLGTDQTATVDTMAGSSAHATVTTQSCDCAGFADAPQGLCIHRLAVMVLRRSESVKAQRQGPPTPETDGWSAEPPQPETLATPLPKRGRFQPARRRTKRLRMALVGAAKTGKTLTALRLASALGERIAVIDTEHESADWYADEIPFDTVSLTNFHPRHYIEALQDAVAEGYQVVIIDSLSHAWAGAGGLLEVHAQVTKRKNGKSFEAWGDVTPIQNQLIEAILTCPVHVIVTMRAKMGYVVEENEKGKQAPRKIGLAPVQRGDTEYEFDLYAEMDHEHTLVVDGSRLRVLDKRVVALPDRAFGLEILAALQGETGGEA